MIRILIWLAGTIAVLAIVLSVFLQPNDFSLCPWNNGEPSTRDGCQKADAIIVVSGGDTSARTAHAIDLYQHGWADYLIFSGAAEDKTGPSNAEAMRQQAIAAEVPTNVILIEEQSNNTRENAQNTQELLEYYAISDVILVTSGYHQRRASMEFASATEGTDVTLRNSPANDRNWGWWWWMTPTGWYLALSEAGKIIVLRSGGGA